MTRRMGVTLVERRGYLYLCVRIPTALRHAGEKATREKCLGKDSPELRREAERLRADATARLARRRIELAGLVAPTLAEMAKRYQREDTGNLAATTRGDLPSYLREDGPIAGPLGAIPMDRITVAKLREWWGENIEGKDRSTSTGRRYLTVLSSIYAYATDLGLVDTNPVPGFRAVLRRRTRTKAARAESDPRRRITPIEDPLAIERVVAEAQREGPKAHLFVLLCLDAGLRAGEAAGLRWGHVRERSLSIEEARPRGGKATDPKSGRAREVDLSRRLAAALAVERKRRFSPALTDLILPGWHPSNFNRREWRRLCARAGVGLRKPKDLRDTYASHLLTLGVPLAYLAAQLGHSTPKVTVDHYARFLSATYVEPPKLVAGEVPADLLARLAACRALREQSASGA